ncbi:MAG: hypothetical protein AAFX56_09995 [Pseudomonadota bacterium]
MKLKPAIWQFGLLALLIFLGHNWLPPFGAFTRPDLQDALHAPGFAAYTLALLWVFRGARARHTLVVVLAVTTAIVGEAAQIGSPRDASMLDFARDLLGIAAALSIDAYWRWRRSRAVGRRIAGAALAVALTAATLSHLSWLAYLETAVRQNAPALTDFGSLWTRGILHTIGDERLEFDRRTAGNGLMTVRLTGSRYSGIRLTPLRDWRGYEQLEVSLAADASGPLSVVLRIIDENHDYRFDDRFNQTLSVDNSTVSLIVDLSDVVDAPRNRKLDAGHITDVAIFALQPREGDKLIIGNLQLR